MSATMIHDAFRDKFEIHSSNKVCEGEVIVLEMQESTLLVPEKRSKLSSICDERLFKAVKVEAIHESGSCISPLK